MVSLSRIVSSRIISSCVRRLSASVERLKGVGVCRVPESHGWLNEFIRQRNGTGQDFPEPSTDKFAALQAFAKRWQTFCWSRRPVTNFRCVAVGLDQRVFLPPQLAKHPFHLQPNHLPCRLLSLTIESRIRRCS